MADFDPAQQRRASGTAQLFEQLARRVLERRNGDDLHASQWSALRYFSRAGRHAATVIGLSRYLGNTSGSTSRTAKSLVERGLLSVQPAAHDGRAVTFSLTEEGNRRLEEDPLHDLSGVLTHLDETEIAEFSRILDKINSQLRHLREE
ncbi:MarR family winged helix-turn-helix transcriptional regulator [Parvularcula marina]|nr:MarR family transcriptional regulator [Parvularcula marina]